MYKGMRRAKQILSSEDCFSVLARGTSGVLAMVDENHRPYTVPLSYGFDEKHIYFHCAAKGTKLDLLRQNPAATFCIIDMDKIVPEEYTTYFRSINVFGKVRFLEDLDEKRQAFVLLTKRYSKDLMVEGMKKIENALSTITILSLDIEEITGKEAIEFVRAKENQGE